MAESTSKAATVDVDKEEVGKADPILPEKASTTPDSAPPATEGDDDAASEAITAPDAAETIDSPVQRSKSYMRVRVGSMMFSSLQGDILGNPWIAQRTHQYSTAKFTLNDPSDSLRLRVLEQEEVEIEIGFVGGERQNIFVGEVWAVSRIPPDGCEVEAVDPSAKMQTTGTSVSYQEESAPPTNTEDTTAEDTEGAAAEDADAEVAEDGAAAEDEAATPVTAKKGKGTTPTAGVLDTPEGVDGWTAMQQMMGQVGTLAFRDRVSVSESERQAKQYPGLKFADNRLLATFRQGGVRTQQGALEASQKEAKSIGDVVVARGKTVRQVAPGEGTETDLVLDYSTNRSAFIGRPKVTKRSGLMLAGPVGALTVSGWSPNDKTTVSATVVTPGAAPGHPTGNIQVPDWGNVDLSAPIFDGTVYTWADATKNGSRVPTREIMERIVAIAQVIQPLTDQTVGAGNKWTITSWYRDPASNARCGGAPKSRHLSGDAVDAYFPGMMDLHSSLYDTYVGGLAVKNGSFIHLDARGSRSRWNY